ncbi:MAG: glycosyltransferase family 4 protein [Bacteroidota bacterium]
MKIFVIGTRGIPGIQGGIEKHCEELYPRLADQGHDITVITRRHYVRDFGNTMFRGVKLMHVASPVSKYFEAIIHTFIGIWIAKYHGAEILHIHGIGPSIFAPLAKLLGMNVVMTHQGEDYRREKWGPFARLVLRLGEAVGVRFADAVIAVSHHIAFGLSIKISAQRLFQIPNGVSVQPRTTDTSYLQKLGLLKNGYILCVGRLVKEKGMHDVIQAYSLLKDIRCALVIAGSADHETSYSRALKRLAEKNKVVMAGTVTGENMRQLYSHAKLFIQASYHEGLPISLLEAMSYHLDILVSDIPAHLEVGLSKENYFHIKDVQELAKCMTLKLSKNATVDYSSLLGERFNWDMIAKQTAAVYLAVKGESLQ